MRKLFFTMILMIGFGAAAQQVHGVDVEDLGDKLELTITKRFLSAKVNVQVDAGQDTKFINFAPRKNYFLVEGGARKYNRVEFNSTADVLSYFSGLGYEFEGVNGYAIISKPNTGLLQILGLGSRSARGQRILLTK